MTTEKIYTMLCLGDSYTIGEAVEENERFPLQAVDMLKKKGIYFEKPTIIAKTGWTTDELSAAVKDVKLKGTYDVVTLLIGVNNQYRGRDLENYRKEFTALMETALNYSGEKNYKVYVLSIPDWGPTPFGSKDKRSAKKIGEEIDEFNSMNYVICSKYEANYVNITPVSREAKNDATLITADGLHPSGKMYKVWAQKLAEEIEGTFKREPH